jgi:hypothetical protein
MNEHVDTLMKNVGDVSAVTLLVGYFLGALPVLATLLTITWTALRIFETKTVQKWLGKDNGKNEAS